MLSSEGPDSEHSSEKAQTGARPTALGARGSLKLIWWAYLCLLKPHQLLIETKVPVDIFYGVRAHSVSGSRHQLLVLGDSAATAHKDDETTTPAAYTVIDSTSFSYPSPPVLCIFTAT